MGVTEKDLLDMETITTKEVKNDPNETELNTDNEVNEPQEPQLQDNYSEPVNDNTALNRKESVFDLRN